MEQELIATAVSSAACPKCGHAEDVQGLEAFSPVQCTKCRTSFPVPVMLGPFLLVERMGAGGMGAVYRALDTALNRFVAIKVMKPALGEDAGLVQSFLREARAAAALNHRNIVQIYSCGQEGGQPYIVMELVTGGRMSAMFSREKPMDEIKLLKLAYDVAEGLQAANQAGLVHGDIKPENVLVDKQGTAKIVDFGLAQFVNAQKERGEIWGTPYYISPERARGNKADHRSDIYSLGATMFHALAGEPPFEGETPADVVLARIKHPPPSLAGIRPGLQQETVDVIERMMAADPSLRYPNPASLKSDINAAIHAAKNAAHAARTPKRKARAGQLVLAAAAAVILALGVFWFTGTLKKEPATSKDAAKTRSTAPAIKPAAVPLFDDTQEDKLKRIIGAVGMGNLQSAESDLSVYGIEYRKKSLGSGYLWTRLFRLVPLWLTGQELKAAQSLANDFSVKDTDPIEDRIPKTIAAWLNEKESYDALVSLGSGVNYRVSDVAAFLEGVKLASLRQWAPAQKKIRQYLATSPREPGWMYVYDSLARELDAAITTHLNAASTLDQLIGERKLDEARRELQKVKAESLPMFAGELDAYERQLEDLQAQQVAEQKAIEESAYRERVQQDIARLDTILAEIIPGMLRSNSFSVASVLITSRTSGMDTDEGRAAAQVAREQVDALEGLKKFLFTATEMAPFTRRDGFRLGGDMTRASLQGIRTSVSGRTQAIFNWHEVPPDVIAQAVDFYSRNELIAANDRAEALVSLTVFSVMHQQPGAAAGFAARALELNPGLMDRINRLAPGVIKP